MGIETMASDSHDTSLSESTITPIDVAAIKTDSKDIVRRSGRRSLQATLYWCIGSVLCLFVYGIIAIAVLLVATVQLTESYKWLAKTKVLAEDERQKWTRRLGWLTVLVVLVGLIEIARILLFVGMISGSGGS
jgi:hypothetical protein